MKYYIVLLLFVFCCGSSFAQEHVYEDTSIMASENGSTDTEEVIPAPIEEISTGTVAVPDTVLRNNGRSLSYDSLLKLKDEKRFAYAKKLDSLLKAQKAQKEKPRQQPLLQDDEPSALAKLFNSRGFQYVLWGAAILFVLFIVYKLFSTGSFLAKDSRPNNVNIVTAEEEKHVKDRDFDRLINNAVKQQNYRLATRYLYLQLLQKLSLAGAIDFAADKTNSEYLREITGKTYKEDVAMLTRYYEYVWYGEFAIDENQYRVLAEKFKRLPV